MRITIIRIRTPRKPDVNEKIRWLSESLGLFGERDRESSCYRVFIEVLKGSRSNRGLSSDELAYRLNLSRGTVMHHVNKLMQAGIVTAEENRYLLRVHNLEALMDELQKDLWRSLADLRSVAREVDEELGL